LKDVVALGGNALDRSDHQGVYEDQLLRVKTVSKPIAELIGTGHHVVITHGNGPQAGNLALKQIVID
jgi:carbamate kinase